MSASRRDALLFYLLTLSATAVGLWLFRNPDAASASPAPDPPASLEATPLMDGDYFPSLHAALTEARRSIVCVMYRVAYNPEKPRSLETILIEDLVAAHARGVRVEALFDANRTYWKESDAERRTLEKKNEEAIARLRQAGVPVFVDGLETVTHAKIVVIDDETVFVGSANWTGAALKDNHEANVRIRSREVAMKFLEALKKIERTPAR